MGDATGWMIFGTPAVIDIIQYGAAGLLAAIGFGYGWLGFGLAKRIK